MQTIYISDPEWQETFPHRVAPLPDEWLAGLLLRCDEANDWESGTTFAHFRRAIKWQGSTEPYLTVPSALKLDYLAQCLGLPISDLLATTYQSELARCYGAPDVHYKQLSTFFVLCVCPECLAQNRRMRRALALPGIGYCPDHHIALVEKCLCGAPLQLFSRHTQPFTCHFCGLDWASLPRLPAEKEKAASEQKLLSCYEFFFSKGTPELLEEVLWRLTPKLAEKEKEYCGIHYDRYRARWIWKPPSYRSRHIRCEFHYKVEGGACIAFHSGKIVLGNLVELLARFELFP